MREAPNSPNLGAQKRKGENGEVLFLQDTPGGVLHGLAAPDWRGEICVGRTSMLTQKIDGEFRLTARVQVAHLKVRRVGARRAFFHR